MNKKLVRTKVASRCFLKAVVLNSFLLQKALQIIFTAL